MCVQENPLMHNGHPCEDLYPKEYFEDGITNGANWYNVPGMPASLVLLCYSPHSFFSQKISQSTLLRFFSFFTSSGKLVFMQNISFAHTCLANSNFSFIASKYTENWYLYFIYKFSHLVCLQNGHSVAITWWRFKYIFHILLSMPVCSSSRHLINWILICHSDIAPQWAWGLTEWHWEWSAASNTQTAASSTAIA